jgi:hypothetical protein
MLGLYKNEGGHVFIDIAPTSEVGQASLQFLAFGAFFFDVDNDGWLDILTANGHLDEDIDNIQRDVHYEERPLLFRNVGAGRFREIGQRVGAQFSQPVVGRGAAYADIDMDGDLDVAITTNGGVLRLFRNDSATKPGVIRLLLQGEKSNRSGIGAIVETKIGTDTTRRALRSGSSYLSQSELAVTLGLGMLSQADSVKITWPSGAVTDLGKLAANQMVIVQESKGQVSSQPLVRS